MVRDSKNRLKYYVPSVSLIMFIIFIVMAIAALLNNTAANVSVEVAVFFFVVALFCLLFQPLYYEIPRLTDKRKKK